MTPAGRTSARTSRRVGRYLVTGRIGRGGMGMVYRAYDEALDRELALKTLTIEGSLDEESRRRFEIEAKAAARLQHPNIVTVFELGEDRGVPFIAMELLPGMDLEALLRSGEPLLLQERLDVLIQVCRGLAYAHEQKIVHRDIKPSNVRLLDDGTVKIMDFGIAKLAGTGVTKTGMMVGTVHYMSPEQVRGKTLDGRSDVFSLGVILYELLQGRRPFVGEGATQVLYRIVHDAAAPLAAGELGEFGPRLQQIVERTLVKDPEERYTASRLGDELADVLAGQRRSVAVPSEATEVLNLSKRLLKEGRVDESLRRLGEVTERLPESLELRRVLRAARRELIRRQRPPESESDVFTELEATFQAPPTQRAPGTALQPTVQRAPFAEAPPVPAQPGPVAAPSQARPSQGRAFVWAAAGALVLALGLGGFLLMRRGQELAPLPLASPPAPVASASSAAAGVAQGAAPASATLSIASTPAGAAVSIDGRRVAGATPLTLNLDPRLAHRLTIVHEGHAPAEVQLEAGRIPPEVRVTLQSVGPAGSVAVSSSYPLDVLWRGRVLAKGQSDARISLPAGRQTLTLQAPAYFLRQDVAVEVRGSEVSALQAPALGKLNVRAQPDNCQVFIDGVFVDYPPILDRAVSAGSHTVAFKWPDGARQQEAVQVPRGGPAYVTGRKE